jgi:hypothetical protein
MSNNPILPIVPTGAALIGDGDADDELDEGETTDSQDTVDKDVREAGAVNEKLTE